jgi:hypothetical protein
MRTLTVAQRLRLAAEVVCDQRTIVHAYDPTWVMRPTMLERVGAAAQRLGYPPPCARTADVLQPEQTRVA